MHEISAYNRGMYVHSHDVADRSHDLATYVGVIGEADEHVRVVAG